MGSGTVRRRYSISDTPTENECNHDGWRQPRVRESTKVATRVDVKPGQKQDFVLGVHSGVGAVREGPLLVQETTSGRNICSKSTSFVITDTAPGMGLDADTDGDCMVFSELADAASKAFKDWQERKHFRSSQSLGDVKEEVEIAARKLDLARDDFNVATTAVQSACLAIDVLSGEVEAQHLSITVDVANWKLGDLAIRRGKGLCVLSVIHHDMFPPSFEVRMAVDGTAVGTEVENLVSIPSPQVPAFRVALHALEIGKSQLVSAEESLQQAQDDLSRQHQRLVKEVEDATSSTPMGFPSLSELQRLERDAVIRTREYERQQAHQVFMKPYPSAHAGTSRECFQQPVRDSATRDTSPRIETSIPGVSGGQGAQVRVPPGFPNVPEPGPEPAVYPSRPANQQHRERAKPTAQQQPEGSHPVRQVNPDGGQNCSKEEKTEIKWIVYHASDGQPYYYNESTGATSWEIPSGTRYKTPAVENPAAVDPKNEHCEDPFAELRRQDEEMMRQRAAWSEWYAQYCNWYQAQAHAQADGNPNDTRGPSGRTRRSQSKNDWAKKDGGRAQTNAAASAPAPPSTVEDQHSGNEAACVVKTSLLREMTAMVQQNAPIDQKKKALRCLQMRWHPDKNLDRVEVAKDVFQFIEETKPWFLQCP